MEVVSRIYHSYIVWMTRDDGTAHWRYNLARLPRAAGAMVDGPDETETVGPFSSEEAAYQDAVRQIEEQETPAARLMDTSSSHRRSP